MTSEAVAAAIAGVQRCCLAFSSPADDARTWPERPDAQHRALQAETIERVRHCTGVEFGQPGDAFICAHNIVLSPDPSEPRLTSARFCQ
jgi:hypothetical protein